MTVLVDVNLSPTWIGFLRDSGIEAHHWSEIGELTEPDESLLTWAIDQAAVILTHDLDFGALLAIGGHQTPSVVQLRFASELKAGACSRSTRVVFGHDCCQ